MSMQVNTEPKKSRLFHLDVVISKVTFEAIKHMFINCLLLMLSFLLSYQGPNNIYLLQAKIHGDRELFVQVVQPFTVMGLRKALEE